MFKFIHIILLFYKQGSVLAVWEVGYAGQAMRGLELIFMEGSGY